MRALRQTGDNSGHVYRGHQNVDKIIGDRRDSGIWKLEDGMLGMQFTKFSQGQPFALRVYQYQDTNLFKGWSPTEERWIWFLVQPGKAKELI